MDENQNGERKLLARRCPGGVLQQAAISVSLLFMAESKESQAGEQQA